MPYIIGFPLAALLGMLACLALVLCEAGSLGAPAATGKPGAPATFNAKVLRERATYAIVKP